MYIKKNGYELDVAPDFHSFCDFVENPNPSSKIYVPLSSMDRSWLKNSRQAGMVSMFVWN
jgi:hypothetical protein